MKKKYRIVYDRVNCIGAASCALFSNKFEMAPDNKANLIGSKPDGEFFILEIEEKDLEDVVDAAKSCPVNVIQIFDAKTNERIA